jgi:16S rRNA (guanine527-N7)-methyltransferase
VEHLNKEQGLMFHVEHLNVMMKLSTDAQRDFDLLQERMSGWFSLDEVWPGLEVYLSLLHRWSNKINLISHRDLSSIATKHLSQALMMAPFVASLPRHTILDLGSGSGLPAIPLKLAFPDSHFILVESRRKRAHFLREVIRYLKLDRIEVVNERIEDWQGKSEGVDLVISRAVGSPQQLLKLVHRHLSPYGWVLSSLSGEDAQSATLTRRVEVAGVGTTLGLSR